jgi:hypothetical protein
MDFYNDKIFIRRYNCSYISQILYIFYKSKIKEIGLITQKTYKILKISDNLYFDLFISRIFKLCLKIIFRTFDCRWLREIRDNKVCWQLSVVAIFMFWIYDRTWDCIPLLLPRSIHSKKSIRISRWGWFEIFEKLIMLRLKNTRRFWGSKIIKGD